MAKTPKKRTTPKRTTAKSPTTRTKGTHRKVSKPSPVASKKIASKRGLVYGLLVDAPVADYGLTDLAGPATLPIYRALGIERLSARCDPWNNIPGRIASG